MPSTAPLLLHFAGVSVRGSMLDGDGGDVAASSSDLPIAFTASFKLDADGITSAGVFDVASGTQVHQVFSGKRLKGGTRHKVNVSLNSSTGGTGRKLELRVASAPHSKVKYVWEGVIGNTGPLTGPGAMKGLNPPSKIQVVGDQAVWCLG